MTEWSQDWDRLEEDRATHGFFFREAEAVVEERLLLRARHKGKTVQTFTSGKMDLAFPIRPSPTTIPPAPLSTSKTPGNNILKHILVKPLLSFLASQQLTLFVFWAFCLGSLGTTNASRGRELQKMRPTSRRSHFLWDLGPSNPGFLDSPKLQFLCPHIHELPEKVPVPVTLGPSIHKWATFSKGKKRWNM